MLKLNGAIATLAIVIIALICILPERVYGAGSRRANRKAAANKRQAMIPMISNDGDNRQDYYDPAEEEYDFTPLSPCSGVQRGDPDLTTYDIISSYRFDEYHYAYQGMQQIVGSTGYQTAYRFEEYTNMTIESTQAFPKGVPDEFSFECTFRVPQKQPQNEWFLFELANYELESLMSVTMNPIYHTIDLSLPKYDGSIQTVSFSESQVFDYAWHKIMFGVSHDSVRLWVDCKPVPAPNGTFVAPLDVRSPIDASDGVFSVAKNCRNLHTVPIDLQWMIFSCDVDKPDHTSCEDLPQYAIAPKDSLRPDIRPTPNPIPTPVPYPDKYRRPDPQPDITPRPDPGLSFLSSSTQRPWIVTSTPSMLIGEEVHAKVCPEQCPAGPPGFRGERGEPGIPGPPGPPGAAGKQTFERQQVQGEKGDTGERGEQGKRGEIGEKGEDGQPGIPGPNGFPGPVGAPGPIGPHGTPGLPGPPGPPGLPGPTGPSGADGTPGQNGVTEYSRGESQSASDDEIRDICMTVVREYIAEISSTLIGPPGPPGRRGASRAGPPGPQGIQGEAGIRGPQGERGYPGAPGVAGLRGDPGIRGEEGPKGDRGEDGVGREGPVGPPGPMGPEGRPGSDGRAGKPGDQGDVGRAGEPGGPGPVGSPGICDCGNQQAPYAAYQMMLAQQQQNNKGPSGYYSNKGPQSYYNKGP